MRRSVKPLPNGYGGSNPSLPTQVVSALLVYQNAPSDSRKESICSHRLSVRTSGFHPEKRGSIPRGNAKKKGSLAQMARALAWQARGHGFEPRRIHTKRRGVRVAEGARLESVYTPKAYRGFESPSLRKTTNKNKRD